MNRRTVDETLASSLTAFSLTAFVLTDFTHTTFRPVRVRDIARDPAHPLLLNCQARVLFFPFAIYLDVMDECVSVLLASSP